MAATNRQSGLVRICGLVILRRSNTNGSELLAPQMSNYVNFSYCGNWARVNQKPFRLITISSNASRFPGFRR
jgi:hypothetical protein